MVIGLKNIYIRCFLLQKGFYTVDEFPNIITVVKSNQTVFISLL